MPTIIQRKLIETIEWKARNGLTILRISLGLIFMWFGVVKYFPGVSTAETIASDTISALTFGLISPAFSMPILATWEGLIGIGLLMGKFMRSTLLLLYVQMLGTFLPLVLFPDQTWTDTAFVPTLLGQYIIKNIILISSAIVLGATANGGLLIANPVIAHEAYNLENQHRRFHRRFNVSPEERKTEKTRKNSLKM
ncbi:DoxX family protein [Salegentibacter sp. JZCK2]|uniref:DoxX family protein n=1 Tax=Salegentibacter tibetensis TaxID=2873600 RepID=UPI001CC9E8B8|nr:DoxX family protein [Salegentibacter tibetensis]MBZ9731578.1 DoxX family protein [Salegentibacter tibetensis]